MSKTAVEKQGVWGGRGFQFIIFLLSVPYCKLSPSYFLGLYPAYILTVYSCYSNVCHRISHKMDLFLKMDICV